MSRYRPEWSVFFAPPGKKYVPKQIFVFQEDYEAYTKLFPEHGLRSWLPSILISEIANYVNETRTDALSRPGHPEQYIAALRTAIGQTLRNVGRRATTVHSESTPSSGKRSNDEKTPKRKRPKTKKRQADGG